MRAYPEIPIIERITMQSRKYFPITSLVEKNRKIIFMAFALKGKVLRSVKGKVISTCGRGHYVIQ